MLIMVLIRVRHGIAFPLKDLNQSNTVDVDVLARIHGIKIVSFFWIRMFRGYRLKSSQRFLIVAWRQGDPIDEPHNNQLASDPRHPIDVSEEDESVSAPPVADLT
jgi:hypothetical protein